MAKKIDHKQALTKKDTILINSIKKTALSPTIPKGARLIHGGPIIKGERKPFGFVLKKGEDTGAIRVEAHSSHFENEVEYISYKILY